MAQVVEVSGVDVDDAVARALRQLGLNRDQVDIEVVREGRRGFLGFGSEESIVRVTAKPTAMPGGGRGGDRGRRGGRGRGQGGPGAGGVRNAEVEQQRREGVARSAAEADDDDEPPARTDFAPAPSRGGYSGRAPISRDGGQRSGPQGGSRSDRGPRVGGRDSGGRGPRDDRGDRGGDRGRGGFDRGRPRSGTPGTIVLPVRVPGAPVEGPVAPIMDAEDELDLAGHTLRDLLTMLGLTETEITARDPETPGDGAGLMSQVFDITGLNDEMSDELGVLIGRRGETLQAVQYLLNVIVSSRYEGDQIFAVDIEHYRRRREQALIDLAQRVASEVRATGDVITLEPMPPAERRIIHLTLQEEEGVSTASVGDGPNRQVEVMPA